MQEEDELLIHAGQACHDRLVQHGVDLSAYNSAATAADIEDLRVVLGYSKWNLYGGSYGSRIALTVMRDFPQGVRSVILDSAIPPLTVQLVYHKLQCQSTFRNLRNRIMASLGIRVRHSLA